MATTPGSSPTALADVVADPAWIDLKQGVAVLRQMQSTDGAIDSGHAGTVAAHRAVWHVAAAISELVRYFPYDADYLDATITDLRNWVRSGFDKPDFSSSIGLFRPGRRRKDRRCHLVVFPMYARNGDGRCSFEAMVISEMWPRWLQVLERGRYRARAYVPLMLADFTSGFEPEAGLWFPDTVSTTPRGSYGFDRDLPLFEVEAARFRTVCAIATRSLHMTLSREVAAAVDDCRTAQRVFLLLGLLRRGDSYFTHFPCGLVTSTEPGPYWMRAIEELRRDLSAYLAAAEIAKGGHPLGLFTPDVLLLDRMLRATLVGSRWRNFDSLAGQVLFGCLRKDEVVSYRRGRLSIDNDIVPVVVGLADEIDLLYKESVNRSRTSLWMAGHRFISRYVSVSEESTWSAGTKSLSSALPDEFPLSMFFQDLSAEVVKLIAGTPEA